MCNLRVRVLCCEHLVKIDPKTDYMYYITRFGELYILIVRFLDSSRSFPRPIYSLYNLNSFPHAPSFPKRTSFIHTVQLLLEGHWWSVPPYQQSNLLFASEHILTWFHSFCIPHLPILSVLFFYFYFHKFFPVITDIPLTKCPVTIMTNDRRQLSKSELYIN